RRERGLRCARRGGGRRNGRHRGGSSGRRRGRDDRAELRDRRGWRFAEAEARERRDHLRGRIGGIEAEERTVRLLLAQKERNGVRAALRVGGRFRVFAEGEECLHDERRGGGVRSGGVEAPPAIRPLAGLQEGERFLDIRIRSGDARGEQRLDGDSAR